MIHPVIVFPICSMTTLHISWMVLYLGNHLELLNNIVILLSILIIITVYFIIIILIILIIIIAQSIKINVNIYLFLLNKSLLGLPFLSQSLETATYLIQDCYPNVGENNHQHALI